MGNRMGHARKLEPVDDASVPREAQDLSVADPTDCQILDEQAVLDILESDPGAPPDQSISDDRDNTDTSDDITRNLDMAEYLSRLERETGTEPLDSDTLRGTSRMKSYPLDKTSWAQHVSAWFRKN